VHTILQGVDTELFAPNRNRALAADKYKDKAAEIVATAEEVEAPAKKEFTLPPMVPGARGTPVDWTGRFVVFSGGKLERRKGQDILMAAFKQFRDRHPRADALLVVAWHNYWPEYMKDIGSAGHVQGYPQVHPKQKHRILFQV
jgi:glycosyltransferase involved in cell wall biosynthesis